MTYDLFKTSDYSPLPRPHLKAKTTKNQGLDFSRSSLTQKS